MFWAYYREIDVHMAQERLSMMRSVLSALGVAFQKKEQAGTFPASVRADLKSARYMAE